MWQVKEVVPEGVKNYTRRAAKRLPRPDCFIGSAFVERRVLPERGCYIAHRFQRDAPPDAIGAGCPVRAPGFRFPEGLLPDMHRKDTHEAEP